MEKSDKIRLLKEFGGGLITAAAIVDAVRQDEENSFPELPNSFVLRLNEIEEQAPGTIEAFLRDDKDAIDDVNPRLSKDIIKCMLRLPTYRHTNMLFDENDEVCRECMICANK